MSSTTAAGTISQIVRGFVNLLTRSLGEVAGTAFSLASSSTGFGDLLKTTHSWPPLRSRRTMFEPILPRPIIPICMDDSFSFGRVDVLQDFFQPSGRSGRLDDHILTNCFKAQHCA